MKIFVAGASGRVGQNVVQDLVAAGHQVVAGSRNPDLSLTTEQIVPVKLDLHADPETIKPLLSGVEAIIFTAGSRGQDLLQTDAYGPVKLMQLAKALGIDRFVMLSALYTLEPGKWSEKLKNYYIAKFFSDNYLVNQTDLNYAIIQPGILVDEAGTGNVALGEQGLTSIPIPDVAKVLATVVDKSNTYHQVIQINPGEHSIEQVFSELN